MSGWGTGVQSSRITGHHATMLAAYHPTFVKTHRLYNTKRVTLNGDHGLWVTTTCDVVSISCNVPL